MKKKARLRLGASLLALGFLLELLAIVATYYDHGLTTISIISAVVVFLPLTLIGSIVMFRRSTKLDGTEE